MSLSGITFGSGITVGSGVTVSSSNGTAGVNGSLGYNEMSPPIIPGHQLEDGSATINGSTGFTINDDTATGVAISNLSASNQTFFAGYGTGTKTVYWGTSSTVPSSTVNLVTNSGHLVFYIQGQSGPATYNYPFTFI